MKKLILLVLTVALLTTPCLAQEVEPDGLFSLHGTKWNRLIGVLIFPLPWLFPPNFDDFRAYGFYNGGVYPRLRDVNVRESSYVDTPVASYFEYERRFCRPYSLDCTTAIGFGIILPIGIGVMTELAYGSQRIRDNHLLMQFLVKTDNNWLPEETLSNPIPRNGEKGTTLRDVSLYSINTTFQDNPPIEIIFDPPDGLTVSNIDVISNNEILFDLEIAIDAPTGWRLITVTYDDGIKTLVGGALFNVMEKTD